MAIDRFIDVCRARRIAFVTIWPISARNLQGRKPDEVRHLFGLLNAYFLTHRSFYQANRIRLRVIGDFERLDGICGDLIDTLGTLQAETATYLDMTLTVALNYSGRDEIVRAAQRMIHAGVPAETVDEALFARHLDTAEHPDPDLILRTGGDSRLSGFLPYQAEYAELRFTDTLMPDLEPAEVEALLASYSARRHSQ